MKQTLIPAEWNGRVASELPLEVISLCQDAQQRMESIQSAAQQQIESLNLSVQAMELQINEMNSLISSMMHREQPLDRILVPERFLEDSSGQGTLERDEFTGSLRLKSNSMQVVNNLISAVWIDRQNSIGIPGNNMVVQSIEQGEKGLPTVRLVSETDPHANILLAFDNGLDTWLEWERLMVIPKQRLRKVEDCAYFADEAGELLSVRDVTAGHGWTVRVAYPGHEQLVSGVPLATFKEEPSVEDAPARLALELEFAETLNGVWLEIAPYRIGGRGTVLESAWVSEDGVNWRKSATGTVVPVDGEVNGIRVYLHNVRYARIWLRSTGWYMPRLGLGHPFAAAFMKQTRRSSLLGFIPLGSSTSRWVERLPTDEISVGTLSVAEDGNTKFVSRVVGGAVGLATGISMKILTQAIGSAAVTALGAAAPVIGFLIGAVVLGGLISTKVTREVERVVNGVDVFKGWRSAVGVREIRVVRRSYESYGEWTSRTYMFSKPVKQIALWVHDEVPEGTEIHYFIKAGGGDWVELDVSKGRSSKLDLDIPVEDAQVRIQMRSTGEDATPVVYSFVLEGYA
ncbi:MAG: hypothetical protein KatS3mg023_3734 [Armatimonadota bacterium]|jgi:hypothetical protein|nr:MAG: hypothetical protein KatS3mg023_3734 [Armatimonadota bacterium]